MRLFKPKVCWKFTIHYWNISLVLALPLSGFKKKIYIIWKKRKKRRRKMLSKWKEWNKLMIQIVNIRCRKLFVDSRLPGLSRTKYLALWYHFVPSIVFLSFPFFLFLYVFLLKSAYWTADCINQILNKPLPSTFKSKSLLKDCIDSLGSNCQILCFKLQIYWQWCINIIRYIKWIYYWLGIKKNK